MRNPITNRFSLATLFVFCILSTPVLVSAQAFDDPAIKSKAEAIHARTFTLDTHADLPYLLSKRPDFDIGEYHDPYESGSRIDIPRMRQGGLDGVFWAVFVAQGDRDSKGHAAAVQEGLELFKVIHERIDKHRDALGLARSEAEARALKEEGKIAIFIGVENGYTIGNDLSLLQKHYDLGARYMTLSHTYNNDICDSSTDPEGAEHGGLSDFGVEVVEEMNRLGMLVDVSHISDEAFYDCLVHSAAPLVATHSSARVLYDHARNLSDEMIVALAAQGGVLQMNMFSGYLKDPDPKRREEIRKINKKYPLDKNLTSRQLKARGKELAKIDKRYQNSLATLKDAVDHIDHIVNLVGIDYVGIGPDLDGGGGIIDMYDVSEMGNITYELVKRGYSEEDIEKIWSGNFFRVLKQAEEVAKRLEE